MSFLKGKRALIVGLATDRSIAWGIAQAMHREGAELAFSHIERMTDRVVPLAKSLGSDLTFPMDVANDADIERGFAHLKTRWDAFDILVHAVAFAPREALSGTFIEATQPRGIPRGARHLELQPDRPRPGVAAVHEGTRRRDLDVELSRCHALAPGLQRHGPRQGESRGQRALSGRGSGAARHPRQCGVRGADQDPVRRGHPGASQDAGACRLPFRPSSAM